MATYEVSSLDLQAAEAELIAACIDHEAALRIALRILPLDDFRSPAGELHRRLFYVLAGWLADGSYSHETNRDRLQTYFPEVDVEALWCSCGVVPGYVEAVAQAIVEHNRLADEALAAVRRWHDADPLQKDASVPSPSIRTPQAKGIEGL